MREQMIQMGLWDADDPRDPSKHIEAAWEVVAQMRSHMYQMELRTYLPRRPNEEINCAVRFLKSPPRDWCAKKSWEPEREDTSYTPGPLAICLAALEVCQPKR
ncbi:MAG: hypothetical protein ACYTAO_17765 [Planctomycetota bacterium]|jgi:hypothetical protein